MKTIIRATAEHSAALKQITNALETILHTCDSEEIKRGNSILDEAFATLEKLRAENKLVETVYED